MKVDLTVLSDPDVRIPKSHLIGRSLWSRYEFSSGSYSALRGEDEKFTIRRMPSGTLPEVFLGKCATEEKARKLLDWWVLHDRRLARLVWREIHGHTPEEDLLELIVEAAHAC